MAIQQLTGQQTSATNQLAQAALEAERGRQYTAAENAMTRAMNASLDQSGGYRQLLASQQAAMDAAASGQLGRGVQAEALIPQLQQASYYGADVLRNIGAQSRQMQDQQNQIDYQNQLTQFQWPFNVYNILSSGLGGFTGGQSVTSTTNPNAIAPAAQIAGGTFAGLGALSGIGKNLGFWGGPTTPQPTTPG
jgi:hypothetical protein